MYLCLQLFDGDEVLGFSQERVEAFCLNADRRRNGWSGFGFVGRG